MTYWQWLGAGMLAAFFAFIIATNSDDWQDALAIIGFVVGILTFVLLAALLLAGAIP